MHFPVIWTPCSNIFPSHGKIHSFERKFNKVSQEWNCFKEPIGTWEDYIIEVNPEGLGWYLTLCLPFGWSWSADWDILWKIWGNRIRGWLFWSRGLRHLLHTSIGRGEENFVQGIYAFLLFFWWEKKSSFWKLSWPDTFIIGFYWFV